MGSVKKYTSKDIEISWDSTVCIHSAVCVENLPGVFNLENKPWIDPNGATVEDIMALIGKCPSGALAYKVAGAKAAKSTTGSNTMITLVNNGPLRLKGEFQIVDADGTSIDHKQVVSLCRCGSSNNKPFCDGTHKNISFEA
jgi:uncharacterized Fe-S cluster protein YjdI